MPSLIGNKPNQVPTNGDLGRLAFMDNLDSFTSKTVMDTDITNIAPSLNLDFANSKVLDPRITFTRASTATFYNGVSSAVAEQNLLLHTENWGNAVWQSASSGGGVGGIKTPNFGVAPDGTTTACRIQLDVSAGSVGAQSQIYQNYATSAVLHTSSCWIKTNDASTKTIMGFSVSSSTPTTLTVTGTWQRLTATRTNAGATDNFQIILINGTTSSTADLLVWYPQAEQRSAVTAYTPTTTAAVTNYIPTLSTAAAGVARFDHNPITGESLGLLIEEQRVNLLTYSQAFSTSPWTVTNATNTVNQNIAPDGTQTANKFNEDANTAWHRLNSATFTVTGSHTLSVFAKAGERSWLAFNFYGDGVSYFTYFNLAAGVVGTNPAGSTATITPVGNGWYRCTVTRTLAGGTSQLILAPSTGDGVSSYAGNGFAGVYIWGAQLEAGSFATSYIPTVASQVTRSPDAASMTGTNFSSWFNEAQGNFYSAGNRLSINGGNNPLFNVQNASRNFDLILGNTNTNFRYNSNLVIGSGITGGKFSMSYNANTYVANASVNGSGTSSSTATSAPVSSTSFNIGYSAALLNYFNGHISKLSYYSRALPNSELVEMTA